MHAAMATPGMIGPPVLSFDTSADHQNPYGRPPGTGYYFMPPYPGIQQSLLHPIAANYLPQGNGPAGPTAMPTPAVESLAAGIPREIAPVSSQDHVVELAHVTSVGSEHTRERDITIRSNKALQLTQKIAAENEWTNFYKQAWFKCLIAFLIWLFAGVVFYSQWQEWSFSASLYYTVQAGMSIGFGFPNEDFICEKKDFRPGNAAKYYADQQYDTPVNNGRGGCVAADISKLVTTILILSGSSIAASALGVLAQAILGSKTSWYKTFIKDVEDEDMWKKARETTTWVDDVVVYFQILIRKELFLAIVRFLLWIAVGVIYGVYSEQRMSFLTALYFSVSSLSTAGLESLKPLGKGSERGAEIKWDELHDGHFLFVSFFCVIGVPLYAWALTNIAAGFVSYLNKMQMRSSVYDKLTTDEFELTLCLGDPSDERGGVKSDEVNMHKWVELQLLRLNKVTVSDLIYIKKAFLELDVDKSKSISRDELIKTGASAGLETQKKHEHLEKALDILTDLHKKMHDDHYTE